MTTKKKPKATPTAPQPLAFAYKPLDGLAKSIFRILLDGYGYICSPEIYLVDPPRYAHHLYTVLAADTVFHRTRDHAHDVLWSGLYDLCGLSSMWEPYSTVPNTEDLKSCIEKALTYKRTWRAPDPPIFLDNDLSRFDLLIPVPTRSTGLSLALNDLGFSSDPKTPWRWSLPSAWGAHVLILDELSTTNQRDQHLPLLLMASGETRTKAIGDLLALRHYDQAEALILSLQSWYGVAASQPNPDPQTQDFVNDMETIFDLKEKSGFASAILGALSHLSLNDAERKIIIDRAASMTPQDASIIRKDDRAVLDFFGLRPEPKKNGKKS